MEKDQDINVLAEQFEEIRKMNEKAQLEMGDRVIAMLDSVGLWDIVRARLSADKQTPEYDDSGHLLCSHFGCNRPVRANGLCGAHEKRKRRKVDMHKPVRERRHGCSVDGCDRNHYAHGMCHLHYDRMRRGMDLNKPVRNHKRQKQTKCSVDGCGNTVKAKGLCSTHYEKSRQGVDQNKQARKYTKRTRGVKHSAPIGHPVQLSKTVMDVEHHHKKDCPAFDNCYEFASLKGWDRFSCNACDGPGKKGKGQKGIRLK